MARAIRAYIIGMLLIMGIPLHTAMQEVFMAAQDAYMHKQCDRALQLYNTLEAKTPTVWYNMGNCLYRQGKYVQAIVCFKRAEKNASWALYVDAVYNIALAQQQAGLSLHHSWANYLYEMIVYYSHPLSTLLLQIFFILSFLFFWLQWSGMEQYSMLSSRLGLHPVRLSVNVRWHYRIITLLSLLLLGGVLFVRYRERHTLFGVITQKDTLLYAVPDEHVDTTGEAHETEIVKIIGMKQGWYKIKTSHGIGWVKEAMVERV